MDTRILKPSEKILAGQKSLLAKTIRPIIANKKVIHVDIPVYLNIGDLLIDKGTESLIHQCNGKYSGRYSVYDLKYLLTSGISKDTIIMLQGGGNFGDLYTAHQDLRIEVIQKFHKNRIIIMPQSVHYDSLNCFKSQSIIFNSHSNLTIYARDQFSYDFLLKEIDKEKLGLLPDSALPIFNPLSPSSGNGTLYFRRRDKESTSTQSSVENPFDWEDLITNKERKILKSNRKRMQSSRTINRKLAHYRQKKLRDNLINKAIEKFIQHEIIDTDRLHGLILSNMLGISVIARDNHYGKIKRYMDTWHKDA